MSELFPEPLGMGSPGKESNKLSHVVTVFFIGGQSGVRRGRRPFELARVGYPGRLTRA